MSIAASPRASKRMRYTIDDDTTAYLEARREVTPPSGGYRKISVKSYSPLSSPEGEMTEYPIVAESVETLEMAGFTRKAAEEVFAKFKQAREDHEYAELDDVACIWIDGKAASRDASLPGDNYEHAWKHQGMAASRYERALAAEYKIIRLRDSASGHFKHSVRAIADFVFTLGKNVIKAQKLLEEASRGDSSPSPSSKPSPARRGKEAQRQTTAAPAPTVLTKVDIPLKKDGCTMLYKGGSLERLEKIFTDPNGSKISFEELISTPPTDFHRTDPNIFYAGKHLEVAEMYCGFHAGIQGDKVRMGILHIAVPTELLTRPDFHWIYDPDWRRLVWESRGWRAPGAGLWGMPSDLKHYVKGFGLAGNLCANGTAGIARLSGENDLAAATLSDGNKATQYAFFAGSYPILNDKCEGQVWIEERGVTAAGKVEKSSGKAMTRAKKE